MRLSVLLDQKPPATRSRFKNVASGRQPGAAGAQEPELTRQSMRIPSTAQARITPAQQFLGRLLIYQSVLY
jgi:hypothetical protein